MSHSMDGYTSGSSHGPSTVGRGPPSYEEIEENRRKKKKSTDKEVLIEGEEEESPKVLKKQTSKTSTSSEFKLNGLSYAFTSNAIPNTVIDGAVTEKGDDGYKSPSKGDTVDVEKLDEGRETWGNKIEFILASIGFAVGLGNVWRFPYLCQKNGGGAFLIPYAIMMLIEGIPLFFLEFAIGQRFRRSALGCYNRIHPALKGLGIGCIVVSLTGCIYYIVVIAWSFFYLFASFTSTLPWSPERCSGYKEFAELSAKCKQNISEACTKKENFAQCCVHDPQLYYFYRVALDISKSIEDPGNGVNGKLVGCLILSWVVVCACIIKGVKSSGKAVYFTATFPYILMIILFFVGVTLKGAGNGVRVLFEPKWERLLDSEIWMDAAAQMFFTLGLGYGALISFASYMPIKNNCVRDAYTVVFINCGTSIFAGIVVFSILGHREFVTGLSVTEIGSGPGLAFITFCDAFLQMPVPPLWAVLFFAMLVLLGIDSEFGTFEGLVQPFYDMKWVKIRKEYFTILMSIGMFLIGIGLVSGPGYFVFQMFDDFSVALPLLFIGFFQTIAVSWVYGNDKIANDIEFMTGKRPFLFWMICWKYITPLAIFVIFVANCHNMVMNPPKYGAYVGCKQQKVPFSSFSNGTDTSVMKIDYPVWGKFCIVILTSLAMVPIVVWLVMDFARNPRAWLKKVSIKLSNKYEYHPDPVRVDPTRKKDKKDIETVILKELELEEH